ncbi:MAG TPA: hypothetical protein H9902_13830 [Candidatus Stackebrandtia faecavium]|nr:hypothetical protein [Candidatus Stackebrandtia faecavium]
MSLPTPVLDLAADVVPDAETRGQLSFAYAHGAYLSGIGSAREFGLTCVWDEGHVPDGAPSQAEHVTQADFDQMLKAATTGDGWPESRQLPLTEIAGFAYGILLSDEDGAGTAARGTLSEFPYALAERSGVSVKTDRDDVADELVRDGDPWRRADLLSEAMYRAYVAWFANNGYYFPSVPRRREYAEYFGMNSQVPQAELAIWRCSQAMDFRNAYREFIDLILQDI